MLNATYVYNSSFYTQQVTSSAKKISNTEVKTSFQAQVTEAAGKAQKKEYTNAVEDYKRRHPEYAALVDGQVRSGKAVLRKNGAENVDRDSMTMEEYKQFFTNLMNSIPYDSSQIRDTNVWSVTEKGWEQMKNDPDYEAWILGYTSQDRSFHDPWASWPGVEPRYHTEHFGASIDEHLGQSFPMSGMGGKDNESWWEKRHKRMQKIAEEQEEKAAKENAEKMRIQRQRWQMEGIRLNMMHRQFLNREMYGEQAGREYDLQVSGAMFMSECVISASAMSSSAGSGVAQ